MGAEFLVLVFLCCLAFACLAALGVALYIASATLAELSRSMRRYFQHPQFGMRKLFSLTVVGALACAMLRWLGIATTYGMATLGVVCVVWALGIVCGAQFAVGDFVSQYAPNRRRRSERPLELWDDVPPGDPPK